MPSDVDLGVAALVRQVEEPRDDERRDDAEREGREEQPAPAEVVGDEAAGERPGDRGHPEDGPHHPLVLAALTGRDDVADDGLGQWHHRAHAEALDGAGGDEHPEAGRQPGDDRADHEHDETAEVEAPAPVEVGELADDRHGDRRDEHRRRRDPAVMVHPAELGDDPWHRRSDDGLADGRDEHAEHQPDEHPGRLRTQPVGLCRGHRGGAGGHEVLSVAPAAGGRARPSVVCIAQAYCFLHSLQNCYACILVR